MTDEERKEAERLAEVYDRSGSGNAYHGFITGYAAACEAKSKIVAGFERDFDEAQADAYGMQEALEAERARSQKLIGLFKRLEVEVPSPALEIDFWKEVYEACHD